MGTSMKRSYNRNIAAETEKKGPGKIPGFLDMTSDWWGLFEEKRELLW